MRNLSKVLLLAFFAIFTSCEKEEIKLPSDEVITLRNTTYFFNSGDESRGYEYMKFDDNVLEIGFKTSYMEFAIDYKYKIVAVEGDWRNDLLFKIGIEKDYKTLGRINFDDKHLHIQLFESGVLGENRIVFTKK